MTDTGKTRGRPGKPKKASAATATESQEQIALFYWARILEKRIPELRLLHHIPNGGNRHVATGRRLKDEGVKAGVPDICLPVARGGFHGLYIELKRKDGAKATDNQTRWINELNAQGYRAEVCYGFDEARSVIDGYLRVSR